MFVSISFTYISLLSTRIQVAKVVYSEDNAPASTEGSGAKYDGGSGSETTLESFHIYGDIIHVM